MASLPEESHPPEEVNVGAGEPRPPGMNADEDIELEGPFVEGRNYMGTTIFGNNGEPIQTITYEAISFRGCGSFGSVFQARIVETGDIVAIKRVKQMEGYTHYHDHELEMMRKMNHQNVVSLNRCFYSISIRDELFINFVMEYVPATLNRVLNLCKTANWRMPLIYVKLFMYQIFRGLAYIHNVHGVTHRDLKTRNILVNPLTHQVKLCDFGSATILVGEEPHQSYIGCRHERAPELVFGATQYTSSVDIWSAGCVLGELLLGEPLFPGNNRDRRFEIIKVLGTPTREEIHRMNPNLTNVRFPQIKAQPWHKIFHSRMPQEAIDLISQLLQYSPNLRCTALEACAHPFFDELRQPNARLPLGQPLPQLFNFTQELTGASPELISKLIPEHVRRQSDLNIQQNTGV